MPPYSSTTIASWKRPLLKLAQQIDDALRLGHERRRTHDLGDRARAVRLGRHLNQILHDDEARRCCRDSRCRPAGANIPARGRAARSSSIVASDRIATMSGRGVMTSRTSVSPKSTTDRSRRLSIGRARPPESPSGVDDGARRQRVDGRRPRGRRPSQPADDERRQRAPTTFATAVNAGSSSSSMRSGDRRTMSAGQHLSDADRNARRPRRSATSAPGNAGADRLGQQHDQQHEQRPAHQARRDEELQRIVEIRGERVAARSRARPRAAAADA